MEPQELLLKLKINLREDNSPFFTNEELLEIIVDSGCDIDRATYAGLIRKAENDSMAVSGLTLANNRAYWLNLARLYRKNQGRSICRG